MEDGTIEALYEAVGRVKLKEQLPTLIKNTEYQLVGKIIEQHQRGELSTGNKIKPSYVSPLYAKYKVALNSAPGLGTPDGKVTGLYDSELKVTFPDDETYSINSTVDYANSPSLTQYGENFNELSEQSISDYDDEALLPEIEEYITGITGLEFN